MDTRGAVGWQIRALEGEGLRRGEERRDLHKTEGVGQQFNVSPVVESLYVMRSSTLYDHQKRFRITVELLRNAQRYVTEIERMLCVLMCLRGSAMASVRSKFIYGTL